jgi:hypothetical protein
MPDADLTETLRKLEERLLSESARHTRESLDALLDDAFIEIGASGTAYDKRSAIETLLNALHVERTLEEFAVRPLAQGIALATYVSTVSSTGARSIRSSIWRQTPTGWRIVFHQGTPLRG